MCVSVSKIDVDSETDKKYSFLNAYKSNKIYALTSACFYYVVASASKLNQQWHRCLNPVMASNNDANANKDTFLK